MEMTSCLEMHPLRFVPSLCLRKHQEITERICLMPPKLSRSQHTYADTIFDSAIHLFKELQDLRNKVGEKARI